MVEDGVCVNSFGGLRSRFSFWDLRQRSTSQICEIGLNLGLDSTGKEGSKFWSVAEIQSDLLLRPERMCREKRQYSPATLLNKIFGVQFLPCTSGD